MPVTKVRSKWSSGDLIFHESVAGNGATVAFGEDDTGLDVKFYGETSGGYLLWDESANALKFVGAATEQKGSSGTPLVLGTTAVGVLDIYTTSALTTGAPRSVQILQTMTAASTGNTPEALRVELQSDVKTGAWANAIFAQIDYQTSGAAHGMAATLCTEMIPPNSSLARGALYALDIEFGCGASSTWGSAGPVAFIKMENWGTAAHFSANAFLFHLAGETSATGNMVYTNSLKFRLADATKYLVYGDAEQGLHLGTSGARNVLVASTPYLTIYTDHDTTSGTTQAVLIDATRTTETSSGNDYLVQAVLTSNVKLPGSSNAIYGKVDLSTSGAAHGMASAVCAEMIAPNSSLSRGALYCLELQFGGGASTSAASAGPLAFIYAGGWGSGLITEMDARGYLFDIQGFSEGSNKLVDNDGGAPAATGGIRCRVGATDIWLLYRDSAPA